MSAAQLETLKQRNPSAYAEYVNSPMRKFDSLTGAERRNVAAESIKPGMQFTSQHQVKKGYEVWEDCTDTVVSVGPKTVTVKRLLKNAMFPELGGFTVRIKKNLFIDDNEAQLLLSTLVAEVEAPKNKYEKAEKMTVRGFSFVDNTGRTLTISAVGEKTVTYNGPFGGARLHKMVFIDSYIDILAAAYDAANAPTAEMIEVYEDVVASVAGISSHVMSSTAIESCEKLVRLGYLEKGKTEGKGNAALYYKADWLPDFPPVVVTAEDVAVVAPLAAQLESMAKPAPTKKMQAIVNVHPESAYSRYNGQKFDIDQNFSNGGVSLLIEGRNVDFSASEFTAIYTNAELKTVAINSAKWVLVQEENSELAAALEYLKQDAVMSTENMSAKPAFEVFRLCKAYFVKINYNESFTIMQRAMNACRLVEPV